MLELADSRELTEWSLLFAIHAEEAEGDTDETGEHGEIIEPAVLFDEGEDDEENGDD